MSNKSFILQFNETKEELELIPRRSFITNRKTQLILNVVLIIIIIILVVLINKKEDEIERSRALLSGQVETATFPQITQMEQYNITLEPSTTPNDVLLTNSIYFVERDDWYANDACTITENLTHPIESVIIAHTETDECLSQAACIARVRKIQKTHQAENLCDIKYNFLVGGDGLVYIGQGWNKQGAHTTNHNSISISIAFVGNFEYKAPNNFQINAGQRLIEFGVQSKILDANYIVYPEKYFSNTLSPGKKIVNIIKKWPHYCNP